MLTLARTRAATLAKGASRLLLLIMSALVSVGSVGCGGEEADGGAGAAASDLTSDGPVTNEAMLRQVVEDLRQDTVPELRGFTLALSSNDSDKDFFHTTVDPLTAIHSASGRTYRLVYSTKIFAAPMSRRALRAVLTHELGHMHDYTTLSSIDLASFAIWYGTSNDVSTYEHQTDEFALVRGKALGLEEFRTWLYAHVAPDALAEKQRDYYAPADIERYRAQHPEVADGL